MRVLTAKEVNFVSGGHIDGQADPYSLSGGFQGTGMPNSSGNSIGDVNYSAPTQGEACAIATDLQSTGTILAFAGFLFGGFNPVTGLAGATAALGAGSSLANDCSSLGSSTSSDSSSGSDSGGSCPAPSPDGGG